MNVELLTRGDLENFRQLIIKDIAALLKPAEEIKKQWLKGSEVKKLLNISHGTLQNLRISGRLSFSKIGGTYYYQSKEIQTLLDKNKTESWR